MEARPAYRREIVVLALVALLSSIVAIHFSRDVGKLAFFPFYDDVTYLIEAQKRVDAIYDRGLRAWPRAMLTFADPFRERSSLMINLGVAAFLLLGRESSVAPYVALTALVVAALALLRVLFREVPFRSFLVATVCLLCVPVARGWTIEFRPDITWGFAIALAALFIVRDLARFPVRIGVGAAFAALVKPSALPVSFALLLAALALALGASWRRGLRDGPTLRSAGRFGAGFAAGLVGLGLFTIPAAIQYTYWVLFVAPDPWVPGSGLRFALTYYLSGPGGRYAFGGLARFMVIVVLVALAVLVARRDRRGLGLAGAALALTGCAYAVVSASAVKSVLIGSEFYAFAALAFFHAVLVLAEEAARAAEKTPSFRHAAALALAVPAVVLAAPGPRLPDHPFLERGSIQQRDAEAVNGETFRAAVDARERAGERAAGLARDLGVVSFGPAVSEYFEYHAAVENRPLSVEDLRLDDEAALRTKIPTLLCVSIADDTLEWIRFVADRRNATVIELLRADPSFELRFRHEVGRTAPGGGGGTYYLFCRR